MLVQYEGWLSTFQLLLPILIILSSVENGNTGTTSTFVRTEWPSIDIPLDHEVFRIPKGHNAPQQVHITQGDYEGKAVIISWVSVAEPGPSQVQYGTSENKYVFSAEGTVTNYSFYGYQSGYIHHCLIDGLEYDTKYYYKIGVADSSREFWFRTPPKIDPDASYTFGIIGDLGQTHNSLSTIKHYMQTRGQTVLFVGDLSYADNYKYNDTGVRWDSWSRFIERSAAYQPWIWSAGNHEIEYEPNMGEVLPFKSYLHRFPTPYKASNSSSPLWYAVRMASAHIIVMSSYSPYVAILPTTWKVKACELYLRAGLSIPELTWCLLAMFMPMKDHGDRYPIPDTSAPVYITVGDGGNLEGLAGRFLDPQPEYSAFREASYGHSTLEIKNRTHAFYHWNRNDDGKRTVTDSVVFHNQYWVSNLRRRRLEKNI